MHLLLVEDDPEMQRSLLDQLALHEEFDTVAANDGTSVLEIIGNEHFDIILMDVGLPDMDGRDTYRLIRRKGIHTPVIMLTGMDSDADIILGMDAGLMTMSLSRSKWAYCLPGSEPIYVSMKPARTRLLIWGPIASNPVSEL